MIHGRQSVRTPSVGQDRSSDRTDAARPWASRFRGILLLAALVSVPGCGDNGVVPPDALRFGQIGRIDILLEVPLRLGAGALVQNLRWGSNGAWSLQESISYAGVQGDSDFRRSTGDPALAAGPYATLVTQLNSEPGLRIFGLGDELPQDSIPVCALTRTRLTFTVVDEARREEARWTRCVDGSLATLTPAGAGPDPASSRLAQAALIALRGTLGTDFRSVYAGSVPFATLDRGEDTPSNVRQPMTLTDSVAWSAFWADHAPSRPLPSVDFSTQMVVVGVTGERREAGDSVEVRRILPVDAGTLTHVVERVPGDFCSPAARVHVPFHIVVAPRTPAPFRFAEIVREEVSCG